MASGFEVVSLGVRAHRSMCSLGGIRFKQMKSFECGDVLLVHISNMKQLTALKQRVAMLSLCRVDCGSWHHVLCRAPNCCHVLCQADHSIGRYFWTLYEESLKIRVFEYKWWDRQAQNSNNLRIIST